jgi:hypothetical protein
MCTTTIKRFELVELTVPAASTGRVTFNTIPQLRNQVGQTIIIKNIKIYVNTAYAKSQVNNSIPGMKPAEIPKCVLVLYVNGEESIKQIPLAQLNNIDDAATPYQEQENSFDDLTNVDFDKSYVQFSSASDADTYVIPFGINYIRILNTNLAYQNS